MSDAVFSPLLAQLHEIDFETIQTSGNGDCWLHPRFGPWLESLRTHFPAAEIINYSNFLLFTPDRIDYALSNGLLTRQHTRIDSLSPDIFSRSANLNAQTVYRHIGAFLSHPRRVPLHIGYCSIAQYYRKCQIITGHPPFHGPFTPDEAADMPDEFEAIHARWPDAIVTRISQSLWAERDDPRTPDDCEGECPKRGLLDNVVWVSPDGSVNACGYDDTQGRFVYGNILKTPLRELLVGEERRIMLDRLYARHFKTYPCNPRCCRMYGDDAL